MKRLCVVLGALTLAGCATELAYQGPAQPSSQTAVIVGASPINAGLPMAPILRKVDDLVVSWRYSRVAVLPGQHALLVDCVMGASTIRYHLVVMAEPGHRYVLTPVSGVGNHACTAVSIEDQK